MIKVKDINDYERKAFKKIEEQVSDREGNVFVELYREYFPLETAKKMTSNYIMSSLLCNINLEEEISAEDHLRVLIKTNIRNYEDGLIDKRLFQYIDDFLKNKLFYTDQTVYCIIPKDENK